MNIDKAIEVLKKVRHWIDYGAGELEPTANAVIEAIDTVIAEVEKPIYTAEDMDDFAKFLIGRNTEWITELERNETAKTLIELWEQEMRKKED